MGFGRHWIAAAALSLAAPSAVAQTSTLGQTGAWSSYGGRSTSGTPLCGMSVRGSDRVLHIKYFRGNPRLVIQVIKNSWRIPERQSVPVRMVVGGTDSWRANATGSGQMIEFTIPREQIPAFERAFRGGDAMQIEFLQGNEGAWRASLTGSSAASDTFIRCVRSINAGEGSGGATQPFGNGTAPTQPFGGNAPSQPFGSGGPPPPEEEGPRKGP